MLRERIFRDKSTENTDITPLVPTEENEHSEKDQQLRDLITTKMTSNLVHMYNGNFDFDMGMKGKTNPFISYDALASNLDQWRGARMNLMEHVGAVLTQISTLGERNFFGKKKRFGGSVPTGDMIYVDLANESIKRIINNIIVSLQSVQGEGKQKRAMQREKIENNQGIVVENDSALNVAHQLNAMSILILESTFLSEACFTQEKFEKTYGIVWSGDE